MPDLYTTYVRKMPELYIMFAPKNIFLFFLGGGGCGGGQPPCSHLLRLWLGPRPPPAKSGPGMLDQSGGGILQFMDNDVIIG